jgi:hypothetical protein
MAKRTINAKQAVADIRSGMDDAALLKKYNLSAEGLQSLFDKLVNTGFIDLGEMESRLHGFLGTVVISESDLSPTKGEGTDGSQSPDRKSPPRIHAQQAARDIRLGVNDFALMEKYRLSSKGLQSLFDKLISAGLITQVDLDRRHLGIDHTVDLREEMLSLSGALRYYGVGLPAPSAGGAESRPEQSETDGIAKEDSRTALSSGEKHSKKFQEARENPNSGRIAWYDKPFVVALLLMGPFPLGFYALYRNSTVSIEIKSAIIAGWFPLVIIYLMLLSGKFAP